MYLTSYSSVDVNFKTTLNITSPQKFTPNPNPCNPPTQTLTNFTFSILRPRIISFHSMLQLNTQVNRAWCFHRHARLLISFLAWQSVTDRYRVRVSTRLSLSLSLSFSFPLSLSTIRRRSITSRWPRKDRRPDSSTRIGHGFSVIFRARFFARSS